MIEIINNPVKFSSLVSHFSVRPDAEAIYISSSNVIKTTLSHSCSQKRKMDFVAGRYCARKAFEKLGMKNPPEIGISSDRSPMWPTGWVGSITHTNGFASAAVAQTEALQGLGIDSERIMRVKVSHEVAGIALLPAENALWNQQLKAYIPYEQYVTLVFSAKESVYKCLYPISDIFLEFNDVEVSTVDLNSGEIRIKLHKHLSPDLSLWRVLSGKFKISPPFIHTVFELMHN